VLEGLIQNFALQEITTNAEINMLADEVIKIAYNKKKGLKLKLDASLLDIK